MADIGYKLHGDSLVVVAWYGGKKITPFTMARVFWVWGEKSLFGRLVGMFVLNF